MKPLYSRRKIRSDESRKFWTKSVKSIDIEVLLNAYWDQAAEQQACSAGWKEIFRGAAGLVLYPKKNQTSAQDAGNEGTEGVEQNNTEYRDIYNVSKDEYYFAPPVLIIGRKSKRDIAQVSSLDVVSYRGLQVISNFVMDCI